MGNHFKNHRLRKLIRDGVQDPLPVEKIVSLYKAGVSELELSKRFCVSRGVIRNRLIKYSIPIRGRSEAELLKWQQMPPKKRAQQVEAAHRACTGVPMSFAEKCKHAQTIEKRPSNISKYELELAQMLRKKGLVFIPQKAIGPYNCDLAAAPVAVEVFGGNWHLYGRHRLRFKERVHYILNQGWFLYIIMTGKYFPLVDATATDLITYIEHVRRHESLPREYRVVWSASDRFTSGGLEHNNITDIPALTHAQNLPR